MDADAGLCLCVSGRPGKRTVEGCGVLIAKPPKHKKCRAKGCGKTFTPARPFIQWCCFDCGVAIAEAKLVQKRAKEATRERVELRKAKEKVKTLTEWKNEVQAVFNRYIRLRDGNVCISCGTTNPNIQYAAGHFRTVKAAGQLRYNEDNVNVQCNYQCNSVKGGNIAAYRPALIAKIGIERVEALEENNEEKRYTVDELIEIRDHYRMKLKELNRG